MKTLKTSFGFGSQSRHLGHKQYKFIRLQYLSFSLCYFFFPPFPSSFFLSFFLSLFLSSPFLLFLLSFILYQYKPTFYRLCLSPFFFLNLSFMMQSFSNIFLYRSNHYFKFMIEDYLKYPLLEISVISYLRLFYSYWSKRISRPLTNIYK